MEGIYEVNIVVSAIKTLCISAENAEEAAYTAEILYKSGVVDCCLNVGVEAVSVDNENFKDYYEGRIIKEESNPNDVNGTLKECKNCELYSIYSSIFNFGTGK